MKITKRHIIIAIFVIGLLLGAYRLSYFLYSNIPLGYDPGIYRAIFIAYSNLFPSFDFSGLPLRIKHEPLISLLANLLSFLGISYDIFLTRGIGILSLLPGFILFFILKKKSLASGIMAAFLYRTSICQYEVFHLNYIKQILAVSLMLISFYLISKKNYLYFGLSFFLIFILHRHTALFASITIFFYILITSISQKRFPRHLIITISVVGLFSLIFYLPMFDRLISGELQPLITTFLGKGYGGDFINRLSYFKYHLIVIIISLVGLVAQFCNKQIRKPDIFTIAYIVSLLRVLFGLFNFNRTLVFFDIFAIILTAQAFDLILFSSKKLIISKYLSGVFILIIMSFQYLNYVNNNAKPFISQQEFEYIKNLHGQTQPNAIVMTSHRNYTPWIMGYSSRDWISPGISDLDIRDFDTWVQWRGGDGSIKCNMLKKSYSYLQRPIYLRLGQQQPPENLDNGDCFKIINQTKNSKLYKIEF